MSLFKNMFGSTDKTAETPKMEWRQMTDLGQLNEIIQISHDKPVVIFKHSMRCSISRMALKQFEKDFNLEETVHPYFLDLLNYRDISNEIAVKFNVQHQSPQMILIKNGSAVYDSSHENISVEDLKNRI